MIREKKSFQHIQRHQATKLFNTGQDVSQLQGQTPVPVQTLAVDSRPSTGFETVDLQYTVETDTPPLESRYGAEDSVEKLFFS